MYIPIWVICLVGGWLSGLVTAYAIGVCFNHKEKKNKQIRDKEFSDLMKVSDHGPN